MGKGGQRPPSDADKGLIASEYGCPTQRGKQISPSLHTGARRTPVAAHRASSSGRAAAAAALGSSPPSHAEKTRHLTPSLAQGPK